ncbi:MAG: electron transfer flavoprotein subunit alpha/FixB family protein [Acidimicrobiales bacterium]
MGGTLVVVEAPHGGLRPEVWELVSVAESLSDQVTGGTRLAMLGWDMGAAAEEARFSGVDEVYLVEDERLAEPWPEAHLELVAQLSARLNPEVVLFARTALGTEVAARFSTRLHCPLIQDAVALTLGPEGMRAVRPVAGGAVLATLIAPRGPWVVVPRPHAFGVAGPAASPAPLFRHQPDLPAGLKTRCGQVARQAPGGADIESARVVVAGGAGLGGPEPFELLGELAELMGGALGSSRPPCDAGWVDPGLQVGLTGKTIAPELYLAVGISGATQHLMGCSSADVIVAVNSDPGAPIFRVADYGVVGDWREVIPALRDALRDELAVLHKAGEARQEGDVAASHAEPSWMSCSASKPADLLRGQRS